MARSAAEPMAPGSNDLAEPPAVLAAQQNGACPHCQQPLAPAPVERCAACQGLLLIAERYEITGLLGQGGMSFVYQGRDRVEGTAVAIKVISLRDARDWKAVDLFERGTGILQSLQHPAVPRVFAFVKDAGRFYQVREFFAAGNLESLVRGGLHLDRKRVHLLLKDMLELLDYLHTRVPAVIHRDIKPANIMFRNAQELSPILVDFDTSAADAPSGTATTIVVSPGYTATEQLAGEAQPASDLYSLGMTMLFVLTHRAPLELPRRDGKIDAEAALAPLEPATRHVIRKLIQPELAQRYASARVALHELAGNFTPSAVAPRNATGFFTQKLEFAGISLFRILVGVLLGVIVGYTLLIVYNSSVRPRLDPGPRGMNAHSGEL